MKKHNVASTKYDSAGTSDISVSIGKIEKNTQTTAKDTGWSEAEKERMGKYGYDGLDMVRAWYS